VRHHILRKTGTAQTWTRGVWKRTPECVLLCFIKPILGNRYVLSQGFIVSEPRETHPRSEITDVPTSPCPPLDMGLSGSSPSTLSTSLATPVPSVGNGFWFLVCSAATQLATQLHQRCIQVVCINKKAWKRLTESNGTPAMDLGHMNIF